jgi:glycosyltransferase involved in cell wall biosynthesis
MTPNKLFEYVALGIPVISSDLEGIRDFFNDTEITFFVPEDPESLANKILERIRQWGKK